MNREQRLIFQHARTGYNARETGSQYPNCETTSDLANAVEQQNMKKINVNTTAKGQHEVLVPSDSIASFKLDNMHIALRTDTTKITSDGFVIERDQNDRNIIRITTDKAVTAFVPKDVNVENLTGRLSKEQVMSKAVDFQNKAANKQIDTEAELEEFKAIEQRLQLEKDGFRIDNADSKIKSLHLKEGWKQATLKIYTSKTSYMTVDIEPDVLGSGDFNSLGYRLDRDSRYGNQYTIRNNGAVEVAKVV